MPIVQVHLIAGHNDNASHRTGLAPTPDITPRGQKRDPQTARSILANGFTRAVRGGRVLGNLAGARQ